MAENVSDIVDQIAEEGAFDANDTAILRWLNRRHKLMVARSRSFRKTASAGVTVANQQVYPAPADLVEGLEVLVDSVTYRRARREEISKGALGRIFLSGDGGVFMETASDAGVDSIALYPIPTTAGLAITVYGAYRPPDLLLDNTVPFRVDDDMLEGLMSGVFATALTRPNEARSDLAQAHEQAFAAACEEQRLREKKRLRGSGPRQIRVVGINA